MLAGFVFLVFGLAEELGYLLVAVEPLGEHDPLGVVLANNASAERVPAAQVSVQVVGGGEGDDENDTGDVVGEVAVVLHRDHRDFQEDNGCEHNLSQWVIVEILHQ